MRRVPTLQARLGVRGRTGHVLARRRGGVGLLGLPARLRVGDGLRRLDLDAEPGPGGGGGSGVGGGDGLGVRLRGRRGVVVLLVGGGVLGGLGLAGVRGHGMVLPLVVVVVGVAH